MNIIPSVSLEARGLCIIYIEEVGIFNYEIIEYIPAKKKINVNKNCTLLELICHTSWDETSQNIYNNHLKTIKKSIDKKFKNVVILEDDAIFKDYLLCVRNVVSRSIQLQSDQLSICT